MAPTKRRNSMKTNQPTIAPIADHEDRRLPLADSFSVLTDADLQYVAGAASDNVQKKHVAN